MRLFEKNRELFEMALPPLLFEMTIAVDALAEEYGFSIREDVISSPMTIISIDMFGNIFSKTDHYEVIFSDGKIDLSVTFLCDAEDIGFNYFSYDTGMFNVPDDIDYISDMDGLFRFEHILKIAQISRIIET